MEAQERKQLFDNNWHFALGDYEAADRFDFDDAAWQKLNLPHDWSIEAGFDVQAPAGNDGGYQCYHFLSGCFYRSYVKFLQKTKEA